LAVRKGFDNAWTKIIQDAMEDPDYQDIKPSLSWLQEVLQKTVPFGKQIRAMLGIHVYRQIKKKRTTEEDFKCYVLGWCAEVMQACALIADDIMDGSETRRGKPCWHTLKDVGLNAVNDAFMLENFAYYILHKYLGSDPQYPRLVKEMQRTGLRTIFGQSLDSRFSLKRDMNDFTQKNYEVLVKYKTSYYTFYSPVSCSMILAGIEDEAVFKSVEKLVLSLGYLFQIQDDFLDCFGNPKVTGKVGTDIIDGKCSWLIVKALEVASEEERRQLEKCYGHKNEMDEAEVKRIFDELNVKAFCEEEELTVHKRIVDMIKALRSDIPQKPFFYLLNTIYKRNK